MSANEEQVGGTHYKTSKEQPWDFIERYSLGFMEGNIVKYLTRWRKKGGIQDLEKVRHYLAKLLELHTDQGRQPCSRPPGVQALKLYFEANNITDHREQILISMFSTKWDEYSFNHAQLLLDSLVLAETKANGSDKA